MNTIRAFVVLALTIGFTSKSMALKNKAADEWLIYSSIGVSILEVAPIATTVDILITTAISFDDMPRAQVIQAKNDLRGMLNGEEATPLAQAVINSKVKSLGSAAAQMSEEDIILATYDQLSEQEKTAR